MFIKAGTLVRVKAGKRYAGRVGIVTEIKINAHIVGDVWVIVELYDHETGESPVVLFMPEEVEKLRRIDTDSKRTPATEFQHISALQDLKAA